MVSERGDHELIGDDLDRRIQSHQPPEPSADLLGRCLATLRESALKPGAATPRQRVFRLLLPRTGLAVGAAGLAAALLVAWLVFFLPGSGSKNVLADVYRAWEEAPAYHLRRLAFGPEGKGVPSRTRDTWVVWGVGRRMEVREGDKLVEVLVDNMRWQLQWDIERDCVIAWPSKLADPAARSDDAGVLIPREGFLEWGEKHKAEVVPEEDRLDGKEVEKITLRWPGETEVGTNTVWFDPGTRRPLKQRYESEDGQITEVVIDYPAPDAIPEDRFDFQVPRSALLEVNDPQLGRPLYSEGQTHPELGK